MRRRRHPRPPRGGEARLSRLARPPASRPGIAGERLRQHKAMGLVADIFGHDVLASLRGVLAIGHTRYSTAGDSALLNAQPIMVQSNKGTIAIAHNGNLVNALAIRA